MQTDSEIDELSVVIVGGGLSGALCALHFIATRPALCVRIVERVDRLGPGIAYGSSSGDHILNVPVHRLEIRAEPSFEQWLSSQAELQPDLAGAVAESGGRLGDAFVPRRLFGAYIEAQLQTLLASGKLIWKRGEAVAFLDSPRRGVLLEDGREIEGDLVVLALGNLPPQPPTPPHAGLEDMRGYVADPWAPAALSGIASDDPVLLVGTGLTMVDIALALHLRGHGGDMIAVSRHGLLPERHAFGGSWPPYVAADLPRSPAALLRFVRAETERSRTAGVPWQRVIDALRPSVASVWRSWSDTQRRAFLRHLRARWDVVRHRMAPRVSADIQALIADGRLQIVAGRVIAGRQLHREVKVDVRGRKGETRTLCIRHVINCTGPRTDVTAVGTPLIADARRRQLIHADVLGLGLETESCAVRGPSGSPSDWLFAVGALTRPAWWEITAAPEITAQVIDLASILAAAPLQRRSLADRFQDLGAGI